MTAFLPAPQPARPADSTAARLARPALVATGCLAAVAVVHLRDPHRGGSYGFCPWLLLTGTYCPGCGGLRAVHDLTHGDVAAALSSNVLVVTLIPVAVLLWVWWANARWRGSAAATPAAWAIARPGLWALGSAVAAFTLLRNLEPTAWLAP
jgi:hypothetical protein